MALTKEWVEKELAWLLKNSPESESYIALCRHWLATQWQPIETIPESKSCVLLMPGNRVQYGFKRGGILGPRSAKFASPWGVINELPIGWQPLPEPPQ